jgi:hypothetical protein
MKKSMWTGVVVGVVALIVVMAILIATATPKDPAATAQRFLERGYGTSFRVVDSERDSKLHEGFPDKYAVTCVAVDQAGADAGAPFKVMVRYRDGSIIVGDGGRCWSSPFGRAENAAFTKAARDALDRPLTRITFTPRSTFASPDEIASWGPFAQDPQIAYQLELVVFGNAEQDGPAVAALLGAWLPRWTGAGKARILVAFCGDRRAAVDEPYKGTGYGWRHNTDTLWTIELRGGAIGSATPQSVTAAAAVRHPAREVEAEQSAPK